MKWLWKSPNVLGVAVALFTRAWIEIIFFDEIQPENKSPSSRGRGLKSPLDSVAVAGDTVALFTRAWIEIDAQYRVSQSCRSSPSSRGRGLKCYILALFLAFWWSPSSRGRGLKLFKAREITVYRKSPSSRGRGLKYELLL